MRYRALLITCLSAGLIMLGAVPAHAADYRYWMYWTPSDGAWQYSQLGPASVAVADGDIQGWRFGISTDDGAAAAAPRFDVADAFQGICGDTARADGQIRVALVIDPGDLSIAPPGEQPGEIVGRCAVIAAGSTGASALSAVAALRVENGFVCGINGYPARECAAAVEPAAADVQAAPAAGASAAASSTDAVPLVLGGAAVLLGLVAAFVMRRRVR